MSATEPVPRRLARFAPRGLVSAVAKVAVAAGLLVYVFSRVDFRAVSRVLGTIDLRLFALSALILSISYPLGGLRWWCVIRALGQRVSPGLLTGLFWVAGVVAQVLPNPIGDAARISIAAKRGVGLGMAFRSAFLERVVMVLILTLLILVTAPLLRARVGQADPVWLAPALFGCGLAGCVLLASADRLLGPLRRVPVIMSIAELSAAFRRFLTSLWSVPAYVSGFLAHLNIIVAAMTLGRALSLPLGVDDYLAVMPIAILAVVLPVSVGGWGVREGVLLAILGTMGVRAEAALAFSLMFGFASMIAALPGLILLWAPSPTRP